MRYIVNLFADDSAFLEAAGLLDNISKVDLPFRSYNYIATFMRKKNSNLTNRKYTFFCHKM